MSVLAFSIKGEPGGILITTIHAILPDINNKQRAVIYCDVFPDGVSVDESSEELCAMWWGLIGEWMLGEDDECEG